MCYKNAMGKQEAEITIEYVGRRGDGVGTWEGKPVFVPRALPGERVRVQIGAARDKGFAARLVEIVTPAPERVKPPCPHYNECGGCALQHWGAGSYGSWKEARVRELLDKAGIVVGEWKPPVFVPDRTRRRATFAALMKNKKLSMGFHGARSHDIADIPGCLVLSPRLSKTVGAMRPHLMKVLTDGKPTDIFIQDTGNAIDVMITGLVGSRREPQIKEREVMAAMAAACGISRLSWRFRERDEPEIIVQHAPVIKQSGTLSVELPPGAFLQPSAEGETALVKAVTESLSTRLRVADLYAGCGTFSGPLLAHGKVHAVESDPDAVATLQKSVRGTSGITVERRDLSDNPLTAKELKNYDAVVFDPPRAGAEAQAREIATSGVKTVIGISCNPATFTQDARILCDGGYILQSVQVIDQFTWSAHLELAAVFRRD
jgi:23S rRNA (uracil1939-C5)-methyltransferase